MLLCFDIENLAIDLLDRNYSLVIQIMKLGKFHSDIFNMFQGGMNT